MEIEVTKNLRIKQCLHAPSCWDLYEKKVAEESGKERETPIAYGLDLKQLVTKLPYFELNYRGETVSFEQFIVLFEETQNSIIEALSN